MEPISGTGSPATRGVDEVPGTAAAFNWQGFVVGIWTFLALGCGAVSCFFCWQQVSAVKEHHARYYTSLGVSIVLTVIAFLCIFSYVDGFCVNDKMRKNIERWCREIWTVRAVLGIGGIVLAVVMNFLLIEARFKLWIMLLHTSAVFFIACIIPLRIPFDLVGIWIGCTVAVAWDATNHAYDLGDYATSVIVTLLIVPMVIFRAKPCPSRLEAAEARAKAAEARVVAAAARAKAEEARAVAAVARAKATEARAVAVAARAKATEARAVAVAARAKAAEARAVAAAARACAAPPPPSQPTPEVMMAAAIEAATARAEAAARALEEAVGLRSHEGATG
ncbi:hypothetical protein LINGRAHAP2_LOCUS13009 [Linum grandiflorum]